MPGRDAVRTVRDMTHSAPTSPTPAPDPLSRPGTAGLLSVSLFIVAALVLTQALTAGFFISGSANTRMVHIVIAAVLPYLAIVPTVSAWRKSGRGMVGRDVAVWTTALMVALWVQEALGHMPFAVATVVHVPLGVLLFALPLQLGLTAWRAGA